MRNFCLAMTVFGLVSYAPAAADEIVEQIDAGKAFYVGGDLSRALNELEFALNELRARFSDQFMATLPEPPALWSAEEPKMENGASLFGAGLMVTRRYQEEKGNGRITAELMVDSPMVQAFSAVLSSPIMIANNPALERIRLGEMNALLKWDAERGTGDLSLAFGGQALAIETGQDLDDKAILIDLMRVWDLKKVKKVAGL